MTQTQPVLAPIGGHGGYNWERASIVGRNGDGSGMQCRQLVRGCGQFWPFLIQSQFEAPLEAPQPMCCRPYHARSLTDKELARTVEMEAGSIVPLIRRTLANGQGASQLRHLAENLTCYA